MRVGATQPIEVDVRMVAATNRDPERGGGGGRLREDLFYRLQGVPDRDAAAARPRGGHAADRAPFPASICAIEGRPKAFTAEALERLSGYHWPGNVRELRNFVYRAYLMAPGSLIQNPCLHMGEACRRTPPHRRSGCRSASV